MNSKYDGEKNNIEALDNNVTTESETVDLFDLAEKLEADSDENIQEQSEADGGSMVDLFAIAEENPEPYSPAPEDIFCISEPQEDAAEFPAEFDETDGSYYQFDSDDEEEYDDTGDDSDDEEEYDDTDKDSDDEEEEYDDTDEDSDDEEENDDTDEDSDEEEEYDDTDEDSDEEEEYDDTDDDSDEEEEYDDKNIIDEFFVADEFVNTQENQEMVDLFEIAKSSDDLPENESHSAIYYWAKRKTAAGWVKFALKCTAVIILLFVFSGVLYFNGLLNLIDYKAADAFRQYDNLSDTDYRFDDDIVYSNPVYYNESTTIEGFNESMIDIPKKDVLNILLIGTDVRGGTYEDRGNTDSMILASVNTRDKNIKLTSFMRDMYVDIPGHGWARLNAAYAYGGPQLLFDTLKTNFDVDVDLYVRVNFANFRKIINHVGGVDIELSEAEARYMNKYAWKYKTDPVEPGWQHLDGAQALSYARCRKIDSDFNRTKRQRIVILAFVKEIKHSSPVELNSLLNVILPMIQTNMSKMQIIGLIADGTRYLNSDIETLNVPIKNSWRTETIRKMSVICPNFELNKTAIVAHVYSTYRLDVEQTKYQYFTIPQ